MGKTLYYVIKLLSGFLFMGMLLILFNKLNIYSKTPNSMLTIPAAIMTAFLLYSCLR